LTQVFFLRLFSQNLDFEFFPNTYLRFWFIFEVFSQIHFVFVSTLKPVSVSKSFPPAFVKTNIFSPSALPLFRPVFDIQFPAMDGCPCVTINGLHLVWDTRRPV